MAFSGVKDKMENKYNIREDNLLKCLIVEFNNIECKLDSGFQLNNFKVAFKTFGKINKQKNNAILICHALTGDQYVADENPMTKKKGWWSRMIGPNKPIDTNKFYVICSNVLGSIKI